MSCLGRKRQRAPQLEETTETLPSSPAEGLLSFMAWKAIPGPLSKRKRRLDSLEAAQGAPRDLRRDSRGERSPWLPLETRPDSPCESGMQPRVPVAPGEENSVLDTSLDEVYFALQLLERNRQLSLANRIEDWTSLGQYNWKPEFDIVTRESRRNSRKSTWFPHQR